MDTNRINPANFAMLLAPHITDSETWYQMTLVCRGFNTGLKAMLIKKTSQLTEWHELPCGAMHGPHFSYYSQYTYDASPMSALHRGPLKKSGYHFNNMKHGPECTWYRNSSIKEKTVYKYGYMHGLHEQWYEATGHLQSSQIKEELTYIDGKEHGHLLEWNENGTLKHTCYFVKGVRHGRCREYSGSGCLISEYQFIKGMYTRVALPK